MGKLKIMGKQKPPGGIPLGDFCFPKGKQKPPGGILAYNNEGQAT